MTRRSFRAKYQRRLLVAALILAAFGLFAGAVIAATTTSSQARLTGVPKRSLPAPTRNVAAAIARSDAFPAKQLPIPSRMWIPAIGLNAPLVALGRTRAGTVQVPGSFAQVGWFRPGPEPGEHGAAIILGHVDSKAGPGAFYRLRALRRGDNIKIQTKFGPRLRFVVTGARRVPKRHFPTRLIYRKTGRPSLRLITCDGAFDSSTGHYVDNLIVFAVRIK